MLPINACLAAYTGVARLAAANDGNWSSTAPAAVRSVYLSAFINEGVTPTDEGLTASRVLAIAACCVVINGSRKLERVKTNCTLLAL